MRFRNLVRAGLFASVFSLNTVCSAAAADVRVDRNLDKGWKFIRSEAPGANAAGFDDSAWQSVTLPYTWAPEKRGGRPNYYAGPAWYRTQVSIGSDLAGKSLFLRFGAASRVADVYVNGERAGSHRGCFGAFCLDVTKLVHAGDNAVAVRTDNSFNAAVAPLSGDFATPGGLFREVHLLATNAVGITPLDDAGPGVYLQSAVTDANADVQVTTKLRNATEKAAKVTVVCTVTDATGQEVGHTSMEQSIGAMGDVDAVGKLAIAHPHLWGGRADPYLYRATVEVRSGEDVLDRVVQPLGLRYYKVDPDRGLFLNGKPYDFHGVNYHEGRTPDLAFVDSPAMQEEDNKLICDMGCTGVRMAHYQHDEYEYTLCDRSGLIVWTELALVNKMATTPEFHENIEQQLRELVKQEYNHPSVLFWSMYNEPWVNKDAGTMEQWGLIGELVALAHQLDPGRLTTGAAAPGVRGPINWYMDVTAMNRYSGWYGGSPDEWPKTVGDLRSERPERAIGIGEYGAGASAIQHENRPPHPKPASRWHPEEWQATVHESAWPAIQSDPSLWCKLIWCMFDFASLGRDEGDRAGVNDKGLVTADRKVCKDAYYYYKACWTTEPFAYITDRRFNPRPPGPSDLKVYSNCRSVELVVDGHSLGAQTNSNHVFTWASVQLPDKTVEVRAVATSGGKTYADSVSWNIDSSAGANPAK